MRSSSIALRSAKDALKGVSLAARKTTLTHSQAMRELPANGFNLFEVSEHEQGIIDDP